MKKCFFAFMLCLLAAFSGCMSEEPVPEKEADEAISEEPTAVFETEIVFEPKSEFPLFLKDIFEAGTEIYDQTDKTIKNITVLGDENEFFVTYEYMAREGKNKEFNDDCWLRIWGKKTDDGKYLLERCGGGYQGEMNLEETDITLEDIQ